MIRPPPRFFVVPGRPGFFKRTSFCATDGVEQCFVRQQEDSKVSPRKLSRHANKASRRIHEGSGVEDIRVSVEQCAGREGHTDTVVVVDGSDHQGRLRNAIFWALDGRSRPWTLTITSTAAIPHEHLVAELVASARTWRWIG